MGEVWEWVWVGVREWVVVGVEGVEVLWVLRG